MIKKEKKIVQIMQFLKSSSPLYCFVFAKSLSVSGSSPEVVEQHE